MSKVNNNIRLVALFLMLSACAYGTSQQLDVTIIDRQDSATNYSYTVPGYSNSTSNTDVNCYGGAYNVNCSGSTRTTGTHMPSRTASYDVRGATLSLRLTDGRIAVVNCDSKYALKGDYINRRSCRVPLVNDIEAEFDGNKAKLKWSVSIDGKKFESETYKILAVLDGAHVEPPAAPAAAPASVTPSVRNAESLPSTAAIREIAIPAIGGRSADGKVSSVKPTEPSAPPIPYKIAARFKSTPANAEVEVDGVYWGTTPTPELTILQAGTHTIVVKKPGYKLWERQVDLALGDDLTVNAALEVDATKPHISGLN